MIHNYFLMTLAVTSFLAFPTYSMNFDFGYMFSKESFTSDSDKYGRETVKDVNANGSIHLNGTTVIDSTSVHGSLHAMHADLNKLYVNGSANLEKCILRGYVAINGCLQSKDNIFEGALTICSNTICFDSTTTQSIEIRKITRDNNQQVVMLENNSRVMGDITFTAGNGLVVIDCNSNLVGNVIGGVVIKKDDYDNDLK